jgi:prepilin-type N-terminal cleavage/methylation domain-containing protein
VQLEWLKEGFSRWRDAALGAESHRGMAFDVQSTTTLARRTAGRGAFTLIEILVVVSIISILAAIAVPNFLNAQTRSKVSRIMSDQRTIATALESYKVDNRTYPFRTPHKIPGAFLAGADVTKRAKDYVALTSPVAYLTEIPVDLFEKRIAAPNNLIEYLSPLLVHHYRDSAPNRAGVPIADFLTTRRSIGGSGSWDYAQEVKLFSNYEYGWGLASVGPDGTFGWNNATLGGYGYRSTSTHWYFDYDPTNGTVSDGNIYRFQDSGAKAKDAFPR